MKTVLYAQPYDICAKGFYFSDREEFQQKLHNARSEYGEPVEEFELQFIDGEEIDCALAKAWELNQCNAKRFLDVIDEWDEQQKRCFIVGVGECGCMFDQEQDDPDALDIDLFEVDSLRELAEQFIDEGLFGDIPENIAHYLDYDAIARDLGFDYSMTEIAGKRLAYRCD
ncbi:antirestriction protein ArdA [Sneathiella sp.]|uniref:antirestriction protein ArdA n=1 Tax=Sneathiella sp. TaxID=1964365 RepID=UPI002635EEDF|nr:antirestriction protein ArdA [Sneathiella sp.]MDF2365637.1 antirestriction protein ArdA [Sneathiella sp.]